MQKRKYTIFRIINNNVVTSVDEKSTEIVLMGKGISFNRRVGDVVEAPDVEKIFVLKEKEIRRYLDIIEHIPMHYFDAAAEILEMAEKQLKMKSNPIGYIMLADHIATAIDRAAEHVFIENEMLEEIRFFYPKEFEIGKKALDLIKTRFQTELPMDEAGFIAFHVINLSEGSMEGGSRQRIVMINKVIELTEQFLDTKFTREGIYFERFLTHLKYFFTRSFVENDDVNHGERDEFLYEVLRVQYPEIEDCVENIRQYFSTHYHVKMLNEEKGFLIMHIKSLLLANEKKNLPGEVHN